MVRTGARRGRVGHWDPLAVRGTEGLALGTIGWPGWPERVPSTIDYTTIHEPGIWHRPRWSLAWFPDAFAGTMGGLIRAAESGTTLISPGGTTSRRLPCASQFIRPRPNIGW